MGDLAKQIVWRWVDALSNTALPWELEEMSDETKRIDAFSRELRFGTGGIRAVMGIGPARMNTLTIGRVAQGLADHLFAALGDKEEKSVAIAYDTRHHSRDFAEVTAGVLAANGIRALLFDGPQPTPVLSYAIRKLGCDAGVVITASHNPREYNGFKVYGPTGCQATEALCRGVAERMEQIDPFADVKAVTFDEGVSTGKISSVPISVVEGYRDAVLAQSLGVPCDGLRVAYSPLNGTGVVHVPEVLASRGVECLVVDSQAGSEGDFPTCPKPNPELPEAMSAVIAQALDVDADLALANDPDADRVGVAVRHDGAMRLLTGNELGLLLFDFVCEASTLPVNPVAVSTVVSSPLLDEVALAHGVELRRTLTGFKYIGEQMDLLAQRGQVDRFVLGVEESCGYLRGTYARDKDGVVALMLSCELAAWHKSHGLDLVEALEGIYARFGYVADMQLTRQVRVDELGSLIASLRRRPPRELGGLHVVGVTDYSRGAAMPVVGSSEPDALGQLLPRANVLELRLADGSKVMLRPSGTEPKVKAYLFAVGETGAEAEEKLGALCEGVRRLVSGGSTGATNPSAPNAVLLSGGSGTRLWPLSNGARSKQFLKVLRDDQGRPESMVQRTVRLVRAACEGVGITVATSASQADALDLQVSRPYELSVEPERRDTAPAIMLAAAHVAWEQGADPSSTVVVMPIDTYADPEYYANVLRLDAAIKDGIADIVLLGVEPTEPTSKYGYIVPQVDVGDVRLVERFVEKPVRPLAEELISKGALWNCGVFGFRLGYMLSLISRYSDASSFADLSARYRELPKNSFDYEVVEKAKSVAVIPYSGQWKDLGTWNALCEELVDPISGKAWVDEATCDNVHVINETGLPVVAAGLEDTVIVATVDGILVSGKEASAGIKGLVDEAAGSKPMYERRAWGEYRVIDASERPDGTRSVTNEVVLAPGGQVTYRRHQQRHEVWTFTAGEGEMVVEGEVRRVRAGDSVSVAPGQRYGCRAETELRVIEVQVGGSVADEDVERFGYFWG